MCPIMSLTWDHGQVLCGVCASTLTLIVCDVTPNHSEKSGLCVDSRYCLDFFEEGENGVRDSTGKSSKQSLRAHVRVLIGHK